MNLLFEDKHRSQTPEATIYLSTDGSGAIPLEALKRFMARGRQVFVAFDGDSPGEAMGWRVAQQLPGVTMARVGMNAWCRMDIQGR